MGKLGKKSKPRHKVIFFNCYTSINSGTRR